MPPKGLVMHDRESYESEIERYQRERIAALVKERDRLRWELQATTENFIAALVVGVTRPPHGEE